MIDETQNTTAQDNYFGNRNLEAKGLVERVKGILLSPKTEWPIIAAERPDVGKIITGYVLPLALIPAIASFIGYGLLVSGAAIVWGIASALINFIANMLSVFISAAIINALAGTFNSRKDFGRAIQLSAYASTAVWVAGILNLFPFLGAFIVFAGAVYSIYLFYLGMPHVMQTPQDKVVAYMLVSAVALVVVYFVLALILSPIIFAIFGIGAIASGAF